MKEHLNEATLQAYMDGELSTKALARADEHFHLCADCRTALDAARAEINQFYDCFGEGSAIVPTHNLHRRISAVIAEATPITAPLAATHAARSMPSLVARLRASVAFDFATPSFALCAIVIACALLTAVLFMIERRDDVGRQASSTGIERRMAGEESARETTSPTQIARVPDENNLNISPHMQENPQRSVQSVRRNSIARNIAANGRSRVAQPHVERRRESPAFLPGERSYLETIAALNAVIENNQRARLDPSLQNEYERSLAVVDRAIAETRFAARDQPNDTEPAQLLHVAYQSKIDLLSAVAYAARD